MGHKCVIHAEKDEASCWFKQMNTKQSPYDDIITRHLLDKFDKSIMAEMLAECLAPAGPETPMKMFIVRVAHVQFSRRATDIVMSAI